MHWHFFGRAEELHGTGARKKGRALLEDSMAWLPRWSSAHSFGTVSMAYKTHNLQEKCLLIPVWFIVNPFFFGAPPVVLDPSG